MEKRIVYVSSLLNPKGKGGDYLRTIFNEMEKNLNANGIVLKEIKNTADIWMRDYMPVQIDENTFVTYQYRPDYLCSPEMHKNITKRFSSPEEIMKYSETEKSLPFYRDGVKIRKCNLILDGGNIVICGDKMILTDKVFIENRPKSPDFIVGELKRAFGKEVIIIPSDPYEIEEARNKDELPLCHADGVLAPINDETILIADYGDDPLGYVPQLMNVLSGYFKPENIKHLDFGDLWTEVAWVYINFLRVDKLVLMPVVEYGKAEDYEFRKKLKACNEEAKRQLKELLGVDEIGVIDTTVLSLGKNDKGEMINIDNNGGALHCITWEVRIEE